MSKSTTIKILNAAEELFREQGYQGASLNDITRKAKLSKGAFFHYYKDKSMIANDVLKKYVTEQLFAPLEDQSTRTQQVKVVLMGWIGEMYQNTIKNNYKGGCLLGNWALELSDNDEPMRIEMAQLFLELEKSTLFLDRTT